MSTSVMRESRSVPALARVEARRLARHPVFVVGVLAWLALMPFTLGTQFDYYNVAVGPALFLGLFSTVALFRMTGSMDRAEEALGSTPASRQDRVRALCLACLLPASLGVVAWVLVLAVMRGSEPLAYGGMSPATRGALFFGEIVLACAGGPLLGVAAGRWLRFPGAAAGLLVGLVFVTLLGQGLTMSARDAAWSNTVRLLTPWTQFTSVESGPRELEVWRGSPWWYVGWQVALCVLALLGALLKDAEGAQRSRILRLGAAVGAVGLVFVVLALVLGPDHATLHTPTGIKGFSS